MDILYLLLTLSVVTGVSLFWIVLKDLPRVFRSLRKGIRTRGQIVRDDLIHFRFGMMHFPVIGFRDKTGKLYEVRTGYQRKSSAQEQLREVEVSYMIEDPQTTAVLVGIKFYIPTLLHTLVFFMPLLLFIGALIVLLREST